jgi:hypothetical protein
MELMKGKILLLFQIKKVMYNKVDDHNIIKIYNTTTEELISDSENDQRGHPLGRHDIFIKVYMSTLKDKANLVLSGCFPKLIYHLLPTTIK